VSIVNFKAVKRVDITLTPLTVFVGENGAGKSTVLQALSILKRSLGQTAVNTELPYANLGGLHLLVPAAQTCTITFAGSTPMELKPLVSGILSYRCSVSFDAQGLSAYKTEVTHSSQLTLRNEWNRYGVNTIEPGAFNYGKSKINFAPANTIGDVFRVGGYSIGDPRDTELIEDLNRSFQALSRVIRSTLESFFVVGPLRGLTEPVYPLGGQPIADFAPRAGIIELGRNLATNLAYDPVAADEISKWEKEILGVSLKTELVPGAQVLVKNPETKSDFVNEGFGSNQLLFILERVARSPHDSSIGIEEPEIHLHPKAQFAFGKWASKTVPAVGKQLILLTHSADVVTGILAGVRHKVIRPEEVSVWFFERTDREIAVTKSEVDAEGEVTGPALKSFLESTAAQLSEYT
jgi:predicted ATPase